MPLPVYLAMTALEIATDPLPENLAYMACHFSSYGCGVVDFPTQLPPDSLLILNDRIPVWQHDPSLVARQLGEAAERLGCCGVVLDFQRPDNPQAAAIARQIAQALPCPVAVSENYAQELGCAVFLSAPRPSRRLERHMAPWAGREIWLEGALESEQITLTAEGSSAKPIPFTMPLESSHRDLGLCCTYHIEVTEQAAVFTITRAEEDLRALAGQAEQLGITRMIGLYQQLGANNKNPAD